MNTLFDISSLLVMPFWALLVFAPTWRITKRIISITLPWIVIPASLLHAVLLVPDVLSVWTTVSNPDLASIQTLLATPAGATIAWVHFLAFDLFVGRWAYLDSRRLQLSPWLVSPALALILLFGPLGLLVYLALRAVILKTQAHSKPYHLEPPHLPEVPS